MDREFGLGTWGLSCPSCLGPAWDRSCSHNPLTGEGLSGLRGPPPLTSLLTAGPPLSPCGLSASGRLTRASSPTAEVQRAGVQAARLPPRSAGQSKSLCWPPVKGEGTKPRERWQGNVAT